MTKSKFIVKNSSLQCLAVFSPIFVADTKVTFVYNFVAPLSKTGITKGKITKDIDRLQYLRQSLVFM